MKTKQKRQQIIHANPMPMPDADVHTASNFKTWLNDHIKSLGRSTELLDMCQTGREILRAKTPFPGTGAMLMQALHFANRFNVDLRHLTPVVNDADVTAADAAALLAKILNEVKAAKSKRQVRAVCAHNDDFTMVRWYGKEFSFALGVQSQAVGILWDAWETTGLGVHQQTIREGVDCEKDNFRMDTAFRNHPALGKMLVNAGDGRWRLAEPTTIKRCAPESLQTHV